MPEYPGLDAAFDHVDQRLDSHAANFLAHSGRLDIHRQNLNTHRDQLDAHGRLLADHREELDEVDVAISELQEQLRLFHGAPAPDPDPGPDPDPDPDPDPVPPAEYGRREGPRKVDSAPWYEGLTDLVDLNDFTGEMRRATVGLDAMGADLLRSDLPRWPDRGFWDGKTLAAASFRNDMRLQTILFLEHNPGVKLVDLDFGAEGYGSDLTNTGHIGVVEARGQNHGMQIINLRIADANVHGLEVDSPDILVAGVDVAGRVVGFSGNMGLNSLARDSRFRNTSDYSDYNRWHWGAMKSGGSPGQPGPFDNVMRFERCEWLDGAMWLDITRVATIVDGLIAGSPAWGAHCEIDEWQHETNGTDISYTTFRNNTWGGNRSWHAARAAGAQGNPSHLQQGHITPHMGTVRADHCLIELDLTKEVGWAEWSDSRQDKAPSGIIQNSSGSSLTDSMIVCTLEHGQRRDGMIARMAHQSWSSWERVHMQIPVALMGDHLFNIENEFLTTDQFLERFPTCTVEWT